MNAFAALASHPAGTAHSNSNVCAFSMEPQKGYGEELQLPTNCYTFSAKGLFEGLTLETEHPHIRGEALVFDNGHWFGRNSKKGDGARCKFLGNGTAFMRRAEIEIITPRDETKTSFKVFSRPREEKPHFNLLHVHSGLLPGVVPKVSLVSDVIGEAVAIGQRDTEGLFQLSEGHPVHVLRKDGTVIELIYQQDREPLVLLYDMGESTDFRLDYIQNWIETDWLIPRSVHRACYELSNMIKVMNRFGAKSESAQMQVVDLALRLRKEGTLKFGSHNALVSALHGAPDSIRWRYTGHDDGAGTNNDSKSITEEQKKLRVDRLKAQAEKKQARVERDKAAAAERASRKRYSQGVEGSRKFQK